MPPTEQYGYYAGGAGRSPCIRQCGFTGQHRQAESPLRRCYPGEKGTCRHRCLPMPRPSAARDGLKAQKTEKARSAYRERHESDFIIADAATRYFRAHRRFQAAKPIKPCKRKSSSLPPKRTPITTNTGQKKARVQGAAYREKQSFSNPARRDKTERKSTNMSVKNRPETIPKRGYALHPIRNTAHL